MVKIILTADTTLMSDYNSNIFLGFAACAPKFLPKFLYKKLFCPSIPEIQSQVKYAHCGQRKIQSALLNNGYNENDIAIVRPDKIIDVISQETKVLCITTHDPLGLGPASSTFSDLGGRETYTSYYFRKLITNPLIRKFNLHVFVGGSGAWQLTDERITAKMNIDTVVVGEGEKTAPELIDKAIKNEPLPNFVRGEVVPLEQIPKIAGPTIDGLIEICRGCGRGCRFCNPTMLNFRSQPLNYVLDEAKINIQAGNGVTLHAEDVLRYQAKGFIPNEQMVTKLFREIKKLTPNIGISHIAHASIAAKPQLIGEISEILEAGTKKCPFVSAQIGLETGSEKLIEKHMKGKVKPFKPHDWEEIILQNHENFKENHWIPVETLIMGLPGERTEDIQKTNELMKKLEKYNSIIIPLYFVPIGHLQGEGFFKTKDNTSEHWKLLSTTIKHSIKSSYEILENHPIPNIKGIKKWGLKKVIKHMDKRIQPYLKIMDEGINPIEQKINSA